MSSFAKALKALAGRLGITKFWLAFERAPAVFLGTAVDRMEVSQPDDSDSDATIGFQESVGSIGLIEFELSTALVDFNSQERCSFRLFFVISATHAGYKLGKETKWQVHHWTSWRGPDDACYLDPPSQDA